MRNEGLANTQSEASRNFSFQVRSRRGGVSAHESLVGRPSELNWAGLPVLANPDSVGDAPPSMLSHLSFAVSDLENSSKFYDAVLGAVGYQRVYTGETASGYGGADGREKFAIKARDPHPRVPGAGFHLAFEARTKDAIHDAHGLALKFGGTCNGSPGPRPEYGVSYYAAFFLDPDGYQVELKLAQST